jgi:hypothetical protein
MRHPRHTRFDRLSAAPEYGARSWWFVLLLAAALIPAANTGQPARTLAFGTPSVAFADTGAAPRMGRSVPSTPVALITEPAAAADSEDAWGAEDWREWEAQVQRVQAPPDITAGEPLQVDVRAVGPSGQTMSNALVEITWILPDGQFQDTCSTGVFGQASATRTLGADCRGKRCVVAVTVTQDGRWSGAYSAFAPK